MAGLHMEQGGADEGHEGHDHHHPSPPLMAEKH